MDGDVAFTDWMDGIPRPSLSCSVLLRAEDIPKRAKGGKGVKISAFFCSSMSHLVSLLFFSDLDNVGRMGSCTDTRGMRIPKKYLFVALGKGLESLMILF